MNDFDKYLLRHRGVSSLTSHRYKNRVATTAAIIDSDGYGVVDIYSKMLNDRVIFMVTDIDSDVSNIIKAQLLYLEQLDRNADISMYIDSGGGSVYSGLGMLDTMEFISNDIITINTGLAASMAAVLLCSGTKGKRKALRRSRTMIHQPLGFAGYQQASDMEIDTKEIISLKKELYEVISERTGQPYDKVNSDSDRDYWMNAKEAKKYGMIDEILIRRK